jgi:aminocarboxymuconate-semialdehyde decarboxylase
MEALMVPAFLWNYHLDGPSGAAYCRDVNDELADLQRSCPDRFVGLAVLPLQDPVRAAREVERCVNDLGLHAFALGTHLEGRNLDDPDVVRTLDAIFDADAALMMHPNWFDRIGDERMPRYYFSNSFGVPLEVGLAVMSIAYSGVLDRHPAARVGITHGGGWLPYGIGRLLLRTGQGRDGGGHNQSPPDLYLRRFYYDILIHDELSLELLVRRVGADRLLIGTDYPFKGDIPGGSVPWIRDMGFLTTREKEMILGGNAHRFLGIAGG